MKNIVASVGLVALGASGLQAASIPGFTADSPKPWSVSVTLRGFYDDNINSAHSGTHEEIVGGVSRVVQNERDSFGFEASPSLAFSWSAERTSINAAYLYSFKWYDKKPDESRTEHYDQVHTFNLALDHVFNPRFEIKVTDSFVIGQEPDILRSQNAFTTFQRISGDNIRNYGTITLSAQLTPLFGLEAGYVNNFFDYDNEGGNAFSPSRSGLLDRVEHMAHIDARWQAQPSTVVLVGYQYRIVNYTADEEIGINPETGESLFSDVRDSRMHYVYAGVDHTFLPDLTGSLRAGASFIDYPNDPNDENDIAPYAMASLKYTYMPESYVEAGASYDRTATDLFSVSENGSITRDAQTAAVWASINHRITPWLYGSIVGQLQNSTYHGGTLDDKSDWFFILGLNLEYRFNPHFSAQVGYNFDKLDSDLSGRSFDRNRVYLGVTASY